MKKVFSSLLAGALGLSMIAGVSAANEAKISVTENSNPVFSAVITQAPDFGSVPYSLTDQTATNPNNGADNLVIKVTNSRGGNTGWNVTLSGGDFTNGDTTPLTFSVVGLTLTTGDTVAAPGTGTNVTETPTFGVTGSAARLLSASAEYSSNGIFTTTYTGNQLVVPGGTLVDDYTSTLTITLADAP